MELSPSPVRADIVSGQIVSEWSRIDRHLVGAREFLGGGGKPHHSLDLKAESYYGYVSVCCIGFSYLDGLRFVVKMEWM